MNAPAKAPWLRDQERGSRGAMRFMKWFALLFGRRSARLLLVPICAYFLLFSPRARRISREYLTCALGRPARHGDLWRHYFYFAATLLDRVYFLAGQFDRFDIEIEGADRLRSTLAGGRGCILLGAHLGSFELLRTLAADKDVSVRAVMYENHSAKISGTLGSLNPEVASRTIAPGEIDTMLRLSERLAAGEMVAMLADRWAGSDKTVTCRFFGRDAAFPRGPLVLAHSLRVPVMLFFGLYHGGARYSIRFEPFCDEYPGERSTREAWIRQTAQRYAQRLEHTCRLTPYNWFNFHDFWSGSHD
jgi:predicted LPLAT superfamily acyltransferase